jgi:hypothetical protein
MTDTELEAFRALNNNAVAAGKAWIERKSTEFDC